MLKKIINKNLLKYYFSKIFFSKIKILSQKSKISFTNKTIFKKKNKMMKSRWNPKLFLFQSNLSKNKYLTGLTISEKSPKKYLFKINSPSHLLIRNNLSPETLLSIINLLFINLLLHLIDPILCSFLMSSHSKIYIIIFKIHNLLTIGSNKLLTILFNS